jgi:hypothetical protein
MKRTIVATAVILGLAGFFLLLASPADAAAPAAYTNYHYKTGLVCSDCHSMHLSLGHDYGATTGGATYINVAGGGRLLKMTTGQTAKSQLCLSCHSGSAVAPDVVGANTNGGTANVRSAGALNLDTSLGTNDAGYFSYTGHALGTSAAAPGGTGSFTPGTGGLSCMDCHGAHGSANFRNLNTSINGTGVSLTSMVGDHVNGGVAPATDVVVDVAGAATRPAWSAAGDFYKGANVWSFKNGANRYADLCAACHKGFNVTTSGGGKHPTAINLGGAGTLESQYTTNYATNARVPVLAPNYTTGAGNPPATQFQPTCVSCHQPHGNMNSFGLIMFGATTVKTAATEEGEAGQTSTTFTCQQCHTQGT